MRFAVDENLPDVLCRWLQERGHDVVHVRDWLRAGVPDTRIWDHALADCRMIVTKDHDFRERRSNEEGPHIVFLHVGNCSNADLLSDMEQGWTAAELALRAEEPIAYISGASWRTRTPIA